ncbi:MAG: flagellar basal body protein [Vampirovibrionales bacterium]
MFIDDSLFRPITSLMGAINTRQKIMASNVANAQTPGYTAKSASFNDLLFGTNTPFETRLAKQFGNGLVDTATQDTGKPVQMERELLTMQENAMLYNMATRRLSTIITAMKTATQVGR